LEETKGRIIKSAIKLFANKGFHETKVEDIAVESGVAKGTIYLYFKSKEEIMESSLDFIFSEAINSYNVPDNLDFYESIKMIVENNFRFISENMDFYKMLFKGIYNVNIENRVKRKECKHKIFSSVLSSIEKIISKGINEGKIKRDVSVKDLSLIFVNTIVSSLMVIVDSKVRGFEVNEDEYKKSVVMFLTGGIYER
jgi:TetR/AcrR family fatty acid metabolism transcriptional regulator